jgi:2-keto-3-deoxy-L-rhamnonate aldolase RhmA
MSANHLRNLLNDGKPSLGTRLQSTWPTVTELVGRSQKFDYVEFLAEYAPYDLYALDNLGRAIELFPNFTGLIKMEQMAQHYLAVRAIAAGIQNLLFTDIRTVEDARACVQIVKPEVPGSSGTHGNAGGRAAIGGLPTIVQAYSDAVIVLMVEKRQMVENLESILAVPGIDMIQFGPSDYSMSIGQAGQRTSPQIVEAREHTIKTALKMGVQPRAELTEATEAEYYIKLGVKHFCMAADTSILSRYYAAEGGAMREILGGL